MAVTTISPSGRKPYGGLQMEGPMATWYARSLFGGGQIVQDGIGFELRLVKQTVSVRR